MIMPGYGMRDRRLTVKFLRRIQELNKEEFVTKLQQALAGGMTSGQVAEHVRYYREYIDSEIQKGRTEEEVLVQLGDPRLLARSIKDANKRAGAVSGAEYEYEEEKTDHVQGENGYGRSGNVRRVMLPGWLVMLTIVVIVVIVIGLVSSLLYLFAPVIMAVLLVTLVIRLIQDNRR